MIDFQAHSCMGMASVTKLTVS